MKYVEAFAVRKGNALSFDFEVHDEKAYNLDTLRSSAVCIFQVDNVYTDRQAISACLMKLAGKNTSVEQVFPLNPFIKLQPY